MTNDKELYNRYQNDIPEYETFKSIKDKKLKRLLFTGWINTFGPKAVRDAMKISLSTYYYNLTVFGPEDSQIGGEHEQQETKKTPAPAKINNQGKRKTKNIIDITNYKVDDRTMVDGEFEEIPKVEQTSLPAPITNDPKPQQETSMALALPTPQEGPKPFLSIDTTDTTESICQQLEAILGFLKFQKGTIKVKLDVYHD